MCVMKQDITTFYQLSFLAKYISEHNVLIISEDVNAKIGKVENNKFGSHNLPNRNENSRAYQNTKSTPKKQNKKKKKNGGNYSCNKIKLTTIVESDQKAPFQ